MLCFTAKKCELDTRDLSQIIILVLQYGKAE
jgi:hypothetical protein